MPKPHITRVELTNIDDWSPLFVWATASVFGRNFSPARKARVTAVGCGVALDAKWKGDGEVQCRLRVRQPGGCVLGIIVTHDADHFSNESASNIVPVRIPEVEPRERSIGGDVLF